MLLLWEGEASVLVVNLYIKPQICTEAITIRPVVLYGSTGNSRSIRGTEKWGAHWFRNVWATESCVTFMTQVAQLANSGMENKAPHASNKPSWDSPLQICIFFFFTPNWCKNPTLEMCTHHGAPTQRLRKRKKIRIQFQGVLRSFWSCNWVEIKLRLGNPAHSLSHHRR